MPILNPLYALITPYSHHSNVCVMLCSILLYYVLQHRAPHGWYINKVYEGRDMNFVRADPWSTCVSKLLGCVVDYLFPYKLGQ